MFVIPFPAIKRLICHRPKYMTASRHNRPAKVSSVGGPSAADSDPGDPLRWVWLALISGLFFMRWWQPAEGGMLGDTLVIAQGWFLALILAGWVGLRGTSWRLRIDGWQWAVWLLVAGHLVSGLIVVVTSGDRRAALNLMWEWIAVGVSFPLLRAALSTATARREWTVVALAAALTLAGYGLTQRYLFYPRMVAEYERLRQELDTLEGNAANGETANLPRIQKLRNDLIGSGMTPHMLSGSGRALFEGRLKHSTEALGRFALANTFAGLLVVWLVVLSILTWQQWLAFLSVPGETDQRFGRLAQLLTLTVATGLTGYCLLLTKSRTAFVALLAGLGVYILASQVSRSAGIRQLLKWALIASLGIGALMLLAGLTGGLDRWVLAEAPKSLQYRLEYWWSTLQVIREAPLTGVGPGQFRQSYLAHKLPRSSEEISDPHNLFLDVWANGGVISLIGLSWTTLLFVRTLMGRTATGRTANVAALSDQANGSGSISLSPTVRESGTPPVPAQKIPQPKSPQRTGNIESEVTAITWGTWSSPFRWGAVGSLAVLWLVGGGLETLLVVLLVTWVVLIGLVERLLPKELPSSLVWGAAGLALLVHLSGAGGIAMPAITQLLLLTGIFVAESGTSGVSVVLRTWQKWIVMWLGMGLFAGGYLTAAQPAGTCRHLLEQGDFAQSPATRERYYRLATLADPFNEAPWMRLADLSFQKWRNSRENDDEVIVSAIEAQQRAIQRNPLSFQAHQALGQYYAARAERTGNSDDKINAVREIRLAIQRYPHNAALLAEAARVFALGGEIESAKLTALRALEQDDINHAAGHTDKRLTEKQRQELQQQAGPH